MKNIGPITLTIALLLSACGGDGSTPSASSRASTNNTSTSGTSSSGSSATEQNTSSASSAATETSSSGNTSTPINNMPNLNDITAGFAHTCAITTDDSVKCWGSNNYGQLGNGTTTDSSTPVTVSGLTGTVAAISAGYNHTCALLIDGTAKCWGNNANGQLGNGSTIESNTPVTVSGLTGVIAISAGTFYTCALLSDGTAKCWGANTFGQLGIGVIDTTTGNDSTLLSLTPVTVNGLTGATAIGAGGYHTCALLADSTIKCWGMNDGQLGDGSNGPIGSSAPVPVSDLIGATSISVEMYHSCALLTDSTVKCWGENAYGELGSNGGPLTPVTVNNLSGATQLTTGNASQSTCAILIDSTAKCWGFNYYGQLGNGSASIGTASPINATPVTVYGLIGAVMIAAGGQHTCARLSNGTAQCWGNNNNGQLGNGSVTASLTPVPVINF